MTARAHRWARAHPGEVCFTALATAAFAFRFVVLVDLGAPSGIDGGNWLAFADTMLGDPTRPTGLAYPPLVPLSMAAAVAVLGPTVGSAAYAAACSLAPATGAFAVLARAGDRLVAALAAAPLLFASSVGEATAWGGYPQLLALGLQLVLLGAVHRSMVTPRPRVLAVTALAWFLLAATSHLVATTAAVGAAIVVALALGSVPRPQRLRRVRDVALCSLVALPLAPFYLPLAQGLADTGGGQLAEAGFGVATTVDHVAFLGREAPWLWALLLTVTVLTPVALWSRRSDLRWAVLAGVVVPTLVLAYGLGEARFTYGILTVVPFATALWAEQLTTVGAPQLRWPRRTVLGVLAAIVVVVALRAGPFFPVQRNWYAVLTPEVVAAIDWLHTSTPSDSVVAVNAEGQRPLGWWVEGLGERRTVYATPLRWLNYEDERRRAEVANDLFLRGFPDDESLRWAGEQGVDLVVVVRTTPEERLRLATPAGAPVVYQSPDVVVLSTQR